MSVTSKKERDHTGSLAFFELNRESLRAAGGACRVAGTSDIRPARVHYLLALWGLKEPTRQVTHKTSHSLASRARVGVYYSYLIITIKLS